ncbi:39507_t:CDS:1, partial [Gigaspora margarita]
MFRPKEESEIQCSASSLRSNNDYAQNMLTKYGLNYINNLKTSEAWLQFAKYHPPKYIHRYLFIPEYEINSKDHWKNFVFHIKNNLTSYKQI